MDKPKRQYRDTVFRSYFSEPGNFLALAKAVTGEDYPADRMKDATIEDVLFSQLRNDVAFSFGDQSLIFTEHQSTVNENMPLRLLLYYSLHCRETVPQDFLYRRRRIRLAAPRFFALYNGRDPCPEKTVLRLSDAFGAKSDVELTVTVHDIRYATGSRLLKICRPLHDYSYFIHRITQNQAQGAALDEAIKEAMRHCMEQNVMADFLKQHQWEVCDMVSLVWDEDLAKKSYYEQGVEDGEARGEARGETHGIIHSLRKMVKNLRMPAEQAMDALEIPQEERAKYSAML